jgi:hypothetical protein
MRNSTPLSAAKKAVGAEMNKHASSGAVLMESKKVPASPLPTAKKPQTPASKDVERVSKFGDELLESSSESDDGLTPDESLRNARAAVKSPVKAGAKVAAKAPLKVAAKLPAKAPVKVAAVRKPPSFDDELEVPDEDKLLDDFGDELDAFAKDVEIRRQTLREEGGNHNGNFHFGDGDLEIPETQEVEMNDVYDDEEEQRRREEEEAEAERLRCEEEARKKRGAKSAPPKKALPMPTPPKKPVPVFVAVEEKYDDDDDDGLEFFRK